MMDNSEKFDDLKIPPGNRLEALKGDFQGYYSIRINDQWRITFKWSEGDIYEARIIDYHRGKVTEYTSR
jgi:proteic killer suppression protein